MCWFSLAIGVGIGVVICLGFLLYVAIREMHPRGTPK